MVIFLDDAETVSRLHSVISSRRVRIAPNKMAPLHYKPRTNEAVLIGNRPCEIADPIPVAIIKPCRVIILLHAGAGACHFEGE